MASNTSSLNDAGFDFFIVGGETAGLVLANRLTADPKVSVLVIEAGSDRLQDPRITTPGLATTLSDDPTCDWSFDQGAKATSSDLESFTTTAWLRPTIKRAGLDRLFILTRRGSGRVMGRNLDRSLFGSRP